VTVSHAAGEARDTFEVIGRKGCIRIPKLNGPELRLVSEGLETVEQHPPAENLHLPLVEQFVKAVLRDEPPAVDGSVGREVNRLLAEMA